MNNKTIIVFILAFTVRYLFAYFSGIDNSTGPDWSRYDLQSDNILKGDFNLESSLFITAPLFSYFVALVKLLFGNGYFFALEFSQILLSSISTIFLMSTAQIIFKDNRISILTGVAYCFYPITIYFTHLFSQESIFQSLFIISLFYFSKYLSEKSSKAMFIFAILFSITLLTKSHIILVIPFFLLCILINDNISLRSFIDALIFTCIIFIITMPYGIYNKLVNDTYVIASSGGGGHFLTGHNEDVYTFIVEPPEFGSSEHQRILNMDYEVFRRLSPQLTGLTSSEKQSIYFREGLKWTVANPIKSIKLAWQNVKNYITPGFNKAHYPPNKWLLTFIISTPIFILAYWELVRGLALAPRNHMIILSIFLAMLAFSVIFYSQNRFRVVTIEPWYLMYAMSGLIYFRDLLLSFKHGRLIRLTKN